jgi:transcriptional regulator with XRE-family HTH domain
MLTDTDTVTAGPHPLCVLVRQLRRASGMSLTRFEERTGIPAVVVGAYERGDRVPPLSKLDVIFGAFGYRLTALPVDSQSTRLSHDVVADLRAIADQLEARNALSAVPDPAARES